MQITDPRIVFRKVKTDNTWDWWHVELYDESDMFPVGTAYVIANQEAFAQLNFILVADHWRNRGHAKRLVSELKLRWPNLVSTSPIGEQGEILLRSCGLRFAGDSDSEKLQVSQ